MSDVGVVAIMLAAFLLAIGLVRLLGRLIDPGAPNGGWTDEPPDTDGTEPAGTGTGTDPGGPRCSSWGRSESASSDRYLRLS